MGQKLLVLLDSDMLCDVKRSFFFLSTLAMHGHFACSQVTSCSMLLSNIYRRTVSQEGSGSGVTPGHLWMLFWHSSLQKQMWTLFKYNHSHWRSHRVSLFFLISLVLHQCLLKTYLLKSLGSIGSSYYWTSRWISSFMSMSWSQKSVCTTIL